MLNVEVGPEEKPILPDITQGEWEVGDMDPYRTLCVFVHGVTPSIAINIENSADAKLIAAAPEALTMLYEVWSIHEEGDDTTGEMHARMKNLLRKAGANI